MLEHLGEIGVKRVEWVLFTDHHRELLQGVGRLDRSHDAVAAPKEEQAFLETPNQFRKWHPRNSRQIHRSWRRAMCGRRRSAVKVDRWLEAGEVFEWRGRTLRCLAHAGHSPGGMSYVLRHGDQTCVFIGGVMHDGAKMTNWFDTEWDYGFAKGIDALIASVQRLPQLKPRPRAFQRKGR